MNKFLTDMQRVAIEAKSSIDEHYDALTFLDMDFKQFLINFFKDDISKNLLLTKIFYSDSEKFIEFQRIIFDKASKFFSKLLNIDGLSFMYDINAPLSSIDLIIADTKIASINIFYKQVILYEEVFFTQINQGLRDKIAQRDILFEEYQEHLNSLNNYSIFQQDFSKGFTQHIMGNTLFKKKTKKERIKQIELLRIELLNIENDINELETTRQLLLKNLTNIKYFQEKIQSRLSNHLKYKVTIN